MAYQLMFTQENGQIDVRCAPGNTVHMTPHLDGTWTVDEDEQHRVFVTRYEALNCARKIGGDPDLRPTK